MIDNFAIYLLITFLLLFFIARTSYYLKWLDFPNKRKIHSKPVPFTGGIAISIVLIFSLKILGTNDPQLSLIITFAFLISIIGTIDDNFPLNAGSKLALLIIPILYLIIFYNLSLNNLGNYNYFTLSLGNFQIPFTLLSVLFLINAFNYFDGMDGTLSFATISVFFILYFLTPYKNLQLFFIIIIIPISIFLCFNFSVFKLPKMFLGDGGSLLIGFIVSFILIYIANKNLVHPILLAWSISIFVFEFLSVNIIRLKNKRSLLKAGRDHLHHILFAKTKSVSLTNFYISSANIVFFFLGYLIFTLISALSSLVIFISLFIIFLILRNKYSKNNTL